MSSTESWFHALSVLTATGKKLLLLFFLAYWHFVPRGINIKQNGEKWLS